MVIDQTSFSDLSVFHNDDSQSVYHALNFTRTTGGASYLYQLLGNPHNNLSDIEDTQKTLKLIQKYADKWPAIITNGTVIMIEKFYETPIDDIPRNPDVFSAIMYKIFHKPDYSVTKFSVEHCADFLKGMNQLAQVFEKETENKTTSVIIQRIHFLLNNNMVKQIIASKKETLTSADILRFGYFLRNRFKNEILELDQLYSRMDAYYSLAIAAKKHNLQFPVFVESEQPFFEANNLFHILLPTPVPYDIKLDAAQNFLFLTGANMAGKSTFIKAVGLAVYLAHIGMAVPASNLKLCLFDGILSNINVVDNISKGESYFFNEVQRIKNTITKINNGKKWLVLIDELFKGTNVQDAMRCSSTVIGGLLKISNSLFILSTHLYEIAHEFNSGQNILFRYFETSVTNDQLSFSYQLKEGVSNDRLGYLILKNEGVVKMIESL